MDAQLIELFNSLSEEDQKRAASFITSLAKGEWTKGDLHDYSLDEAEEFDDLQDLE